MFLMAYRVRNTVQYYNTFNVYQSIRFSKIKQIMDLAIDDRLLIGDMSEIEHRLTTSKATQRGNTPCRYI